MITNKELQYVSSWVSKIPYPGINYAEEAARKLIDAYEDFNQFYCNKEYDIILSNGEQILFEILSMNLCHMLGIDSKGLLDDYYSLFRKQVLDIEPGRYMKSYELLKTIIDNIDGVLKYDYDCGGKILNYYRIMVKCSIFEKLSDFSRFNFGVINFDKDLYAKVTNSNFSGSSKKLLYVQSNETTAPIFMMGILPNNNSKTDQTSITPEEVKYVVETLFAPSEPKDFFSEQEVAIPTQILITTTDNMNKLSATASEKIALLNQYRSIVKEYDLPYKLNINGDYEAMLVDQTSRSRTRTKE